MAPKRGTRQATRGRTKTATQHELPLPNFAALENLLDYNKLIMAGEKVLGKEFYDELELAMNELAEQKKYMKQIISTYIGENKASFL